MITFKEYYQHQTLKEAKTKNNPFGIQQAKKLISKQKRLPPKVYKHELKAKLNKKDQIKPRKWHVTSWSDLKRVFQ